MKLCAPRRELQYPCIIAISARVFFGIAVDMPELAGSGWLAAILGGILALPMSLLADMREKRAAIPPILNILWFAPLVYDIACIATGTTYSAEYVALRDHAAFTMRTVLLLTVWCAAWLGGTGLCGAGRINAKLLPLCIALLILFQFSSYRLGYLTPIFGKNYHTLCLGALRSAGWYALLPALWQAHSENDVPAPSMTKCLLISIGMATGLLALYNMVMPPAILADHTRMFQFDALFSNGRFSMTIEFPLILLWFISLLQLMSIELFAAGHILEGIFPRLPYWLLTALPALLAYIVAALRLAEQEGAILAATGQYALAAVWLVLTYLYRKKVSA